MNNINFKELKPVNYNRKSSEDEEKQALSIPAQMEEIERLRKDRGLGAMTILEESKSAKLPNNRKIFGQMITDIISGKFDTILCWKLDRLARNMVEGGLIIDLLQRGIIKFIITPHKIYTPEENALLMAVEFGSANQFVRDLSVNVKRGQRKKASVGIPHGVASLGFLNDKTEEKGNRKWMVDKVRLDKIKLLLRIFLTGEWSAGKLHKYAIQELKLNTVKRKRIGGELIQPSRMYEILKDPVYAGFFFLEGNRYELDKTLPRLITEDEHNKIKAILGKRNIPKVQRHDDAFIGFVVSPVGEYIGLDKKYQVICDCKKKFPHRDKTHCPQCGIEIDKMEHPKYLDYSYYYNISRKKKGLKVKSVSSKKLLNCLLETMEGKIPFTAELADWSRKYIKEMRDSEINEHLLKEEVAQQEVGDYIKRKKKLRELLANELITEDEYKFDLSDLEERYKASSNSKDDFDWTVKANEIVNLSQEFFDVMKNGEIKAQKSLLHKLGTNLVWNEEKLSTVNKKSIQALLDGIPLVKLEIEKFEPKKYIDIKSLNEKTSEISPVFSTLLPR